MVDLKELGRLSDADLYRVVGSPVALAGLGAAAAIRPTPIEAKVLAIAAKLERMPDAQAEAEVRKMKPNQLRLLHAVVSKFDAAPMSGISDDPDLAGSFFKKLKGIIAKVAPIAGVALAPFTAGASLAIGGAVAAIASGGSPEQVQQAASAPLPPQYAPAAPVYAAPAPAPLVAQPGGPINVNVTVPARATGAPQTLPRRFESGGMQLSTPMVLVGLGVIALLAIGGRR